MKLKEIVEQVITIKVISPGVEKEIDDLLWTQELDKKDMEALEQLIEGLSNGTIITLVRHG